MSQKKISVRSNSKPALEFSKEVADLLHCSFESHKNNSSFVDSIKNPEHLLAAFFDCDDQSEFHDLENQIQEKLGIFSDQFDSNKLHFIIPKTFDETKYLFKSPLMGNVLTREWGDVKTSAQIYSDLLAPLHQDSFCPIAKFIPKAKIQTVHINHTNLKHDTIEAIKAYAISAKFKPRMANLIANAADELLMNAIFDAPTNELGKQSLSKTSRASDFALDSKHQVDIQIGASENLLILSVTDYYGSLNKDDLLKHISKEYFKEIYKLKPVLASAGLGLSTVFKSGGSLLFRCLADQRTEITVIFKRTKSMKDFKKHFQFIINLFYNP